MSILFGLLMTQCLGISSGTYEGGSKYAFGANFLTQFGQEFSSSKILLVVLFLYLF